MPEIVPLALNLADNWRVTLQSMVLIGIAEMFDKTWFIALLMALKHDRRVVFMGSFSALFVHVIISAGLGLAISRMFAPGTLDFMSAVLYCILCIVCSVEYHRSTGDVDAIAAGKEEAAATVETDGPGISSDYGTSDVEASIANGRLKKSTGSEIFLASFIAVFIAEWGDRTQIAMVSQHASQPIVPVCVGSAIAFFLLTLSAVWSAAVVDHLKLSERFIHLVSALSFGTFALVALKNGLDDVGAWDKPSYKALFYASAFSFSTFALVSMYRVLRVR